jgi:hypothetical protein
MEKLSKTNKDIDAKLALKLSSGKGLMPNDSKNNVGLSCGLKKVTAYVNYANYQDIADLNFSKSKTIGLIDRLTNLQIIPSINT